MARLDSLGPAKEIAQLGAVIGREFSYDLLSAIAPDLAHRLPDALRQLTQAQLIFEQGTLAHATYSFKHALVQEAAYGALLRSKRQEVHASVARAMEERFPATIEVQPQLIAHHYTEAGLSEPAIDWWRRAGLQALGRSANVEAQSHIDRAIQLLEALPESSDRDALELDLRLRLGAALVGTKGYAVPEFEANYERAWVLSERVGDPVRIFPALNGRWLSSFCRGDLPVAAARAQQFLEVAERQGDAGSQMMGHQILGITQSFRGDGLAARASLARAIALYDPQAHASYIQLYGRNPKVCSLGYLSFAIQQLGYPDQAVRTLEQARAEGGTGHFVTTALALLFTCIAAVLRRDIGALKEPAIELLTLARRHGSQYWELHGQTFVALLEASEGRVEEALEQIRICLFGWEARNSGFMRPWLKLMEIELLFELGRHGEGLRHLDEARDLIERTDIRFCESELLRLRASVLSAHGASDAEIDACFREAVAVARRQSAKFWELRVVTSWARFHRDRQRHALARELLEDVCAWFTEGFDTPDLQEARALLDSLGSAVAQQADSIRRPEGAPALRLVVGQ
jgi:predicted ATPase